MAQQDLFSAPEADVATSVTASQPDFDAPPQPVSAQTWLFKGALLPVDRPLMQMIRAIARQQPFRQRYTPGGRKMSVAMTNCGDLGWVTDHQGYRYCVAAPESGVPWPSMPDIWRDWAGRFAALAGFDRFVPDACLINRYAKGTGMGLHQDRDEADLSAPVVSFSLGAPVIFRWGGDQRRDPVQEILLEHGDVLVWGGQDRLRFHGVKKLRPFRHPLTGSNRFNLTFRRAGCYRPPV